MSGGVFAERARGESKSARTRARLMDAAAEAFAAQGIEGVSVNAIAHAADVSNGTFYNHFRDKGEIVAAVAFTIARDLAIRIDAAMSDLEDPAQRVAFGTRQFIELASSEPAWGRSLTSAIWVLPELRREVTTFARADLERGVRDGSFRVDVDDVLVDVLMSTVMMGIYLRTREKAGPEVGEEIAEHQLRMLGVPPARARSAAHRPLEPLQVRAKTG
jgi:AcrR family transcriptional regulator